MNQIKRSYIKKKNEFVVERTAWLKPIQQIKSVLLICNNEDKSIKKMVEESFPNASVYHLFEREIKEDRTVGFYYSVHTSDFNLTAKVKNDKLNNLLNMQLDLLIDLSSDSDMLDYFVCNAQSALKVGHMKSPKMEKYDLMLNLDGTNKHKIETILMQLYTLTKTNE